MTKRDVIEKLRPHTSIKECELDGYMGSIFPRWLGDPSFISMVDIKLVNCKKCEYLPPLGQLPLLKTLEIERMNGINEVGVEIYGNWSTPFPSLERLHFCDMKSLEKWMHPPVDNKAFSILEDLSISDCPLLQGNLPPHLPSLRTLEICDSRQLQSLELKNLSSSTSCLYVKGCESMISITHIPLTLQSLEIDDCEKLGCVEFNEQPTDMSSGNNDEKGLKCVKSIIVSPKASLEVPLLTQLVMQRCPSLISLQQSLLLPALQNLHLWDCENMERLHAELHNFSSLQYLIIKNFPKIHSFPEGGLPTNLKYVEIDQVKIKQAVEEWGLHLLHCLEVLKLQNVGSFVDSGGVW